MFLFTSFLHLQNNNAVGFCYLFYQLIQTDLEVVTVQRIRISLINFN